MERFWCGHINFTFTSQSSILLLLFFCAVRRRQSTNRVTRGSTPILCYHHATSVTILSMCCFVRRQKVRGNERRRSGRPTAWMSLRWEELQFNNSYERSQGRCAKHLRPAAICRMIYELRQNENFLHSFRAHSFFSISWILGDISALTFGLYNSLEIGSCLISTRHTINVIIFVISQCVFTFLNGFIFMLAERFGHLLFRPKSKQKSKLVYIIKWKWFTLWSTENKNENRPLSWVTYKNGANICLNKHSLHLLKPWLHLLNVYNVHKQKANEHEIYKLLDSLQPIANV